MTTDITELMQREKFEAWVMTQICISKSTLEGLRSADGYRNSTLSGTNYNRMWNCWKAAGAEMVEALEKAQETIAFQQGEIKALLSSLECRTVTAENMQESAYRAGLTAGWNLGLANNNDGFNKCLAAHAAGIKVEGE
ncbi:hypothetical protein PGO48_08215 [Klebsiella aerogenes]